MFLALTVVSILVGLFICWRFIIGGDPILGGIVAGCGVGVLCYLVVVTLPGQILRSQLADYETVSVPIYELGDGTSTSGYFGFFGGSIDSEPAFMYYVKNENGAYELKQVEANRVEIVQTDDVSPHYEKSCRNDSTTPDWARVPVFFEYSGYDCPDYVDYTFYVPENSIKGAYDLDAE